MTRIVLEGIEKRYGGSTAVAPLSLEIAEGEFFSLVGPSGCGKTTTMRMIGGLETPSAGRIRIGGQTVFDADRGLSTPPSARGIGMVFQSYALWPHMTVRQNVGFGLDVRGIRSDEAARRIHATLEQLQIAHLADRYPGELSGGQQQRVALARELTVGARILQLDEPLSNLDARLRMEMRVELKRLHGQTGATFVYVTHDQMEALTLSTRMAVLRDGVVQQVGTPREIYDTPANLFVAEFLSLNRLNTLDATVADGRLQLATGGLALPPGQRLATGHRVVIGLRPDELRLEAAGDIPCHVVQSFIAGATTLTTVEADGGQTLHVVEPGRRDRQPGAPLAVCVPSASVLLFDAASQERLAPRAAAV